MNRFFWGDSTWTDELRPIRRRTCRIRRGTHRFIPELSRLEYRTMLSVTIGLTAPAVVNAGQSIVFQASEVGGSGTGRFSIRDYDSTGYVLASMDEDASGHASLSVNTYPSNVIVGENTSQPPPGLYKFALVYETSTSSLETQSLAWGVDVVTPNLAVSAQTSESYEAGNYTLEAVLSNPPITQQSSVQYTFYDFTSAGRVQLGTTTYSTTASTASIAVSLEPGTHHIGVQVMLLGKARESYLGYNILPVDLVVPRSTSTGIRSDVSIVSQNQPVANYLFNNGSGLVLDDVAGHASGSFQVGSLTFSTDVAPPVVAGQSLDTAHGSPLSAPLATTQLDNVTLSTWVKATSANGGTESILYQGNTASNGYGLFLYQGRPAILVGGQKFLFAQTALPFNTWTLLTARRINGVWKLAVDGTDQVLGGLDEPGAIPNLTPTTPTLGTFIGSNNNGSEKFSGLINNPAIFAKALDDATIRAMASELPPPPNTPLSFTSVVVGAGPDVVGLADPTGTAQLIVDGQLTGPIVSIDQIGQVTLAVSSLSSGWHTIATAYSGDATHAASQSSAIKQYVRPSSLTVAGPAVTTFGDSITWTATTQLTERNAKTVTFVDGTTVLASHVPLDANGRAIFTTPPGFYLNAGLHSITARLEGPDFRWIESAISTVLVQRRALHVTISSPDRVYDGQTATSYSLSDDRLTNGLWLSTDSAAHFIDAQVGIGKTVILTGLHLSGPDAANYILSASTYSTTANITARPVDITVTSASSRVYDGTNSAGFNFTSSSVLAGDDVQVVLSASFASKNVGTQAVIYTSPTLAGLGSSNYAIGQVTYAAAAQTASITARPLNITVTTATSRPYDSTTSVEVTLGDNRILGDVLSVGGSASFDSSQVGDNRRVTYTVLVLQGPDAANYTLSASTFSTTANITARPVDITVTNASSRVYDGTNSAGFNFTSSSFLPGDDVRVVLSAAFASKNVGSQAVIYTSPTLAGIGSSNYAIGQVTYAAAALQASITARPLNITVTTATSRPYNDTTNAEVTLGDDRILGDVLTVVGSASFDSSQVGVNRLVSYRVQTVQGLDASNYSVGQITPATANITAQATKTTLTITSAPGLDRQLLTFLASVSSDSATQGKLSGTIQFFINGVKYGPAVGVINGSASISTADSGAGELAPGRDTITAVFVCDKDSFATSSASADHTVVDLAVGGGRLAIDQFNNRYIADPILNRVYKITPDGTQTVYAGTGDAGWSGDQGLASKAQLDQPTGLAVDALGNLYISDSGNNRVRKVALDGTISTVAGNGKQDAPGSSTGMAAALSVSLNQPTGLAVDKSGNLYIADTYNNLIRVVSTDGMIRTIAGNGPAGTSLVGPVDNSGGLNKPAALATNGNGVVFFADTGNARICQLDTYVGSIPLTSPMVDGSSADPSLSYRVLVSDVIALALAQAPQGTLAFTSASSSNVGLLAPDGKVTYTKPVTTQYPLFGITGLAFNAFGILVGAGQTSSILPASGGSNPGFSIFSTAAAPVASISQFAGQSQSQGIVLTLASVQSLATGSSVGSTAGLLSFGSSALQLSTQLLTAGESLLGLLGTVAFTATGNEDSPPADSKSADEPADHAATEATPENHVPTDPWGTIRKILGVDDRFQHDLESALVAPTPPANETVPAPPPPEASGPQAGSNPDGSILDEGLAPTRERPASTPTHTAASLSSLVDSALNDLEIVGRPLLGEMEIGILSDRLKLEVGEDNCESWAGLVVTLVGLPTMITLSARPPRRQKSWLARTNLSRRDGQGF